MRNLIKKWKNKIHFYKEVDNTKDLSDKLVQFLFNNESPGVIHQNATAVTHLFIFHKTRVYIVITEYKIHLMSNHRFKFGSRKTGIAFRI